MALILGVLAVTAVAMAAPSATGMSCADPEKRQQMLDSHVKNGVMTQEQADLMKKNMDQMMSGGQMNGGNGNHNMSQGNPLAPAPGK